MKILPRGLAGPLILSLVLFPQITNAQNGDDWEYGLNVYGWFPDISGTTDFPIGGGNDFIIPIDDILDSLEFTAQLTFDARKGQWGFLFDAIYMDLSNTKTTYREGTIGGTPIPTSASFDVTMDVNSWTLTGAGYYRFHEDNGNSADFVFGARYLDIEQDLRWSLNGNLGDLELPGREGLAQVGFSNTDLIAGIRGNIMLGDNGKWFIPYYGDIGTGDSDFTWQAVAGLGYNFNWGQLGLTYRVLDYDLPSDYNISDLDFSGPAINARFSW